MRYLYLILLLILTYVNIWQYKATLRTEQDIQHLRDNVEMFEGFNQLDLNLTDLIGE